MWCPLLTGSEVVPLSNFKIQKIWQDSYEDYCHAGHFQSDEHKKASRSILACKSGRLGINVSECTECGHMEFHKWISAGRK